MRKTDELRLLLLLFFIVTDNICSQEPTGNFEPKLLFKISSESFPKSWTSNDIDAKAENLEIDEIERSRKIVENAMSKYPPQLLANNLVEVYILKSLLFYGQPNDGANSTDKIFLVNDGEDKGYTDEIVERSFHNKLSNILLRNHLVCFNRKGWEKQDKNGQLINEFCENILQKGFICPFAVCYPKNDFNYFAENLFFPNKEFQEVIRCNNPEILEKFKMTIEFFYCVHPLFEEEYFENLK